MVAVAVTGGAVETGSEGPELNGGCSSSTAANCCMMSLIMIELLNKYVELVSP